MKKLYMLLLLSVVYLMSTGQGLNPQKLPYASYKEGLHGPTLKSSTVPGHFAKQVLANDAECKIDALLLAADADTWVADVQTYLMNTGMFNVVDMANNTTPTLATLRNYDAILVWADNSLDDTIGDTLAAYIDEGGGVVSAVFNLFTGWGIEGTRFNTDYLLLNLGNYASGATTTLGSVYDAGHPIMDGVTSLVNPNEYRSNNATMTAGSVVVAEWSDGLPLVVVKENLGPANARRADVNIFPPSSTIRGDLWDASTDGDILLANALLWVSKKCDCVDIVVDNDPGICGAVVNYTPPTADGATVTQIDASGLTSGDEFLVGVTVQEFEFDFGGGVIETCSFTVTVVDTEPPVIDCPEDIIVSNDPGECCAVVNFPDLGTVITGEAQPGITLPNATSAQGGVAYNPGKKLYYAVRAGSSSYVLYTYDETGTQLAGNTANFDFRGLWWNPNTSSLEGNSYNANGYRRVDLDANGYALSTGTNSPASNYQPDSQSQADYDYDLDEVIYYHNNSIYRTSRATGALIGSAIPITGLPANTLNSTFVGYTGIPGEEVLIYDYSNKAVYFVDKTTGVYSRSVQLPSSAPAQSMYNTSYSNGHIWIADGTVWHSYKIAGSGLADNCGDATATYDYPSGTCFPVGTTLVTITATDDAGNTSTCTFNVTVNDTEAPVAVCGSSGTGKNVLLLWDTDNANTQSLKTAIEDAGFTVTLPAVPEYQWDGTNPSPDGFDAVIHLNGTTYFEGLSLSAQNALLDFVQVQGKLFVHSEWDAHGIDVMGHNPALAPIVILQRVSGYETDITYNTVPGYETHPVLEGLPSSFSIGFAGHNMGQVRQYGTYPAETLMLDHQGNAAVAVRELEIGKVVGFGHAGNYANSNSLSNANVQKLFINALKWGTNFTGDFEFVLDENGTVTITPDDIDQGSTDNCGIESMELSQTEFTWDDLGTQEVTLTVTDLAGNSSSCTAYITIKGENAEPVVVANPIEVYLNENGIYFLNRDDLEEMAAGTTDDTTPFEDLKLSAYPHIFRCDQIGEIIHTRLSVEDNEGNVVRAWTTVIVLDTIAPKAVCQNIEVYLDKNGEAVIAPEQIMDPASSDACGIETMILSKTLFGCADVGENTVTLTVTDASGNSSVCTAIVTVHDTLAPVFEPVANVEVEVEPGTAETAIEYPAIVVTDNCTLEPELIEGLGPDGMFPVGTTTEVWVVEDGGGNTDTLTFVVTVTVQNAPPTIDPVADVTVDEDDSPVTVQLTGISDGDESAEQDVTVKAVGNNPELISSIMVDYGGGETGSLEIHLAENMNGIAEITITVEDSEGASVTETFILTVNPVNDPPFVVNPIADQVINASYVLKVPVSPVLGELFDDPEGDELTVSVMLEGGEPLPAWAEIEDDMLVLSPMIADTGCVNVVVTATDVHGASASTTFQLCVDGYPVSAGDLAAGEFSVSLYPNPARDMVNLEISSSSYGPAEVSVYTITGKLVLQENFSNSKLISFSMAEQVSGMYFVKLQMDGKETVKKLVLDRK